MINSVPCTQPDRVQTKATPTVPHIGKVPYPVRVSCTKASYELAYIDLFLKGVYCDLPYIVIR